MSNRAGTAHAQLVVLLTLFLVADIAAAVEGPFQPKIPQQTLRVAALTPRTQLTNLAKLVNRFPQMRALSGPLVPATGVGVNGLSYSISRALPPKPSDTSGAVVAKKQGENLIICKTTPFSVVRDLAGPLFIGSGPSINSSVTYPGALFRDTDVVRGQFTPQMLARRPGSITIDVFNSGGAVSTTVSNFNDRTAVVNAINTLRTQAQNAETPADLDHAEFTVSASQELSLGVESSADIDVGPSLQLPVPTPFSTVGANAGVDASLAVNAANSQNFAVGIIDQTFFTISVGGEGPGSTVDDTIAPNILAITDVQYGRIAYIVVSSFASSLSARSVVQELISASNPLVSANQQSQVSASAQFALQSDFVRVKIVGGSSSTAVTVRDLATLRNYIEQIRPTVGGSNAVPIRYTLRYARDNATAFVRASANFNDRECARAAQLKVKLKTIRPTKVVDFGGEELYGTVRVATGAGVTAEGSRTLWEVSSNAPIQGNENVNIGVNQDRVFNLNPLDAPTPSAVILEFKVKDKIMAEEYLGANDFGKTNGFVKYGPDSGSVSLPAVRDAPGSKLSTSQTLTEDGAAATLQLNFDFELVPVL